MLHRAGFGVAAIRGSAWKVAAGTTSPALSRTAASERNKDMYDLHYLHEHSEIGVRRMFGKTPSVATAIMWPFGKGAYLGDCAVHVSITEGDGKVHMPSLMEKSSNFISSSASYLKEQLALEYKIRRHGGPVETSSNPWQVDWAGHPDIRAGFQTNELSSSFAKWENFTIGTPGFWIRQLGEVLSYLRPRRSAKLEPEKLTREGALTMLVSSPSQLQAEEKQKLKLIAGEKE
jgi:hypothetical protein